MTAEERELDQILHGLSENGLVGSGYDWKDSRDRFARGNEAREEEAQAKGAETIEL